MQQRRRDVVTCEEWAEVAEYAHACVMAHRLKCRARHDRAAPARHTLKSRLRHRSSGRPPFFSMLAPLAPSIDVLVCLRRARIADHGARARARAAVFNRCGFAVSRTPRTNQCCASVRMQSSVEAEIGARHRVVR